MEVAMSLHRLCRQLEIDVDYLLWRASVHRFSHADIQTQFAALSGDYRKLAAIEQQEQLERLISRYSAQLR
jgi:hypothetical protein